MVVDWLCVHGNRKLHRESPNMNFEKFTDADLKAMADNIYADLCIAASVASQSDWHSGAFAALTTVCNEMNSRKAAI